MRPYVACCNAPGMKSNSPQLNTRSFDYSLGIRDAFSPIATFFAKSGDQNRRNIDSICASMSRTSDKRLNPILQIQVSSLPSQALATDLFRRIDRWIYSRSRSLHGSFPTTCAKRPEQNGPKRTKEIETNACVPAKLHDTAVLLDYSV